MHMGSILAAMAGTFLLTMAMVALVLVYANSAERNHR